MLTVMDVVTVLFELFALHQATAEAITKILTMEIFLRFGFPRSLRCDNGTQFFLVVQQLAHSMGSIYSGWQIICLVPTL